MTNNTFKVNSCEVCGQNNLKSVLNLGNHPMCDDLVEVGSDRICKEFPIEIMYCDNCFTAHQKYQVPKIELFPTNYHYRSRFTADVLKGMNDLVNSCESNFGSLTNKKVLDIGCNDGSLLNYFKNKGATTFGIEPTGAYLDALNNGHEIVNDFLTIDTANQFVEKYGKMDFITFTNVFAHIENLKEVIDALKLILKKDSILVIENHYLGAIIKGRQFDTFYHEHPRTYSCKSFEFIASSLNLNLLEVQFTNRYGGNIRVYIGSKERNIINENSNKNINLEEAQFENLLLKMQGEIEAWITKKKQEIETLVQKHGKLRAKAFPGRAAILIKLLELNEKQILCAYEKPGSMKLDHYIPGTKIPILSDEELFKNKENKAPIINFAWHISNEISEYLKKNEINIELIDIISEKDFL